ncbi:MAG: SurA N-terminal domain-containing protein [Ardenticatenaceae bacterium]|nr:SurA N-terminal domain-containing protein [Ardenticatenaceae bacterium]
MAKKQTKTVEEERQSRKDILRARRHQEQLRQVRLGVAIVIGLLVLVMVVGIVNEFFLVPGRAVATVNGEAITLAQWQDRVTLERAQRIAFLEGQYDAFEGNVGIIQQFYSQVIIDLQDPEQLGQTVLDTMIEETIIRQQAQVRGIEVTDAEVDAAIGEYFFYYGGDSPTPQPTATATVMPTPSLTPIPTAVITEVVPVEEVLPTATTGPTSTPNPTATPVTEEAFQEQYGDLLAQYREYGADEQTYREMVRATLYRERLQAALGVENEVDTSAEHASMFVLQLATEADANEALAMIEADGFLTVWNTVHSTPVDATDAAFVGATAREYLWQTEDTLAATIGVETAAIAFTLPLDEPSGILIDTSNAETPVYYILQVSGREVRDLPQSTIDTENATLLSALVDAQLAENVEITDFWRARIPSRPLLDPKFLVQPTAVPTEPVTPTPVLIAPTPTADSGS